MGQTAEPRVLETRETRGGTAIPDYARMVELIDTTGLSPVAPQGA
jgi:hypothetical protein